MKRIIALNAAIAAGVLAVSAAYASDIAFGVPSVADPVHTFGEPDILVDHSGRVFVSGPTGTGTQRSIWLGSVDGGQTYRLMNTGAPPSALNGQTAPPGGGDTDIIVDQDDNQYFSDLYALVCFRMAVTRDGGATSSQSAYPGGCAGMPGADREWFALYDPPEGTPKESAYTGPTPLIYNTYSGVVGGAVWVKSNADVDSLPGGPGLNYVDAVNGSAPYSGNGYPSLDQVTGKVLQPAPSGGIVLNIGVPDETGSLTFVPAIDQPRISDLPSANGFVVSSLDNARNLFVTWTSDSLRDGVQTFVSVASAASDWTKWSKPVQVSRAPSMYSVFPWVKAGGPGRANVVWYGSDTAGNPNIHVGQAWDVYMSQVVFPTDETGAVTGEAPSVEMVKVTPHPMHIGDICQNGAGCIAQQGNRNLADFFEVTIDNTGAALIVYDDTSNGLAQEGFTPLNNEMLDHSGAPVVTVIRQSSGMGLFGVEVSGPSSEPTTTLEDAADDALFPVIGGSNVPGLDILGHDINFDGHMLTITLKVADLSEPAATLLAVPGQHIQYVTRWQLHNKIYYAGMQTNAANLPVFYAGAAKSVDLCSVSACDPHVITYPEAGPAGGVEQYGEINCPAAPSADDPCTLTIEVSASDVGNPTDTDVLEQIGSYAFVSVHEFGKISNAIALADEVPIQIDGVCCNNATADASGATSEAESGDEPATGQFRAAASGPSVGGALPLSLLFGLFGLFLVRRRY